MISIDPLAESLAAVGAAEGAVSIGIGSSNVGLGVISSIQSTMATINAIIGQAIGMMGQVLTQIGNTLNKLKFLQVIAFIVIIGKCFFKFISFIIAWIMWVIKFIPWLFLPWPNDLFNPGKRDSKKLAGLLPWLIRFIMTTVHKIIHLPKCFLWYILDTAGWILYLPFRFIFWLFDYILNIGIVKMEHDAWCFLDDIDYFLHGPKNNEFIEDFANSDELMKMKNSNMPDPDSMNTGYHFIHFPDQVMQTCYQVNNYSLAPVETFPLKTLFEFIMCATQPF